MMDEALMEEIQRVSILRKVSTFIIELVGQGRFALPSGAPSQPIIYTYLSDVHQTQSSSQYRMNQDLLSPLINDAYDVEMMMMTLKMMSLDHLNHL